ncbi:secretion-regulating guanine nucleotide exchange factor isoform 3-T3 [Dugong dugon]
MERGRCASAAAAAALFAWGANSYGQLGLGHKEDVLLPQQLNDFCEPGCVKRITGGGGHSAVVTDGGRLFVCGLNKDGQLGLGHTENVLYFTPCTSLLGCPIQQVACGWDFTIILTEGGQVLSCGSNSFGQLGVPHGPRRCVVPQVIELLREKVVCIAAGLRHALAATGLENSKVRCVLAGSDHSASLTDAGELYVWGSNKHGQLATQAVFLPVPQKIEVHCFQNEKVTAIWSGWTHLVAQTETGKVFTWGRADYGQLGRKLEAQEGWKQDERDSSLPCLTPQNSMPLSLHCLTGATEVSCGSEHNLAVIEKQEWLGALIHGINTVQTISNNAQAPEERPDKWELLKIKRLGSSKDFTKRVKRQPTAWEKKFCYDKSNQRLVSKIYKILQNLNSKKTTN